MKIILNCGEYKPTIETVGSAELEGVYNGVGIKTDQGHFGITQRDGGLEIVRDGALLLSTSDEEMMEALREIGTRRLQEYIDSKDDEPQGNCDGRQ